MSGKMLKIVPGWDHVLIRTCRIEMSGIYYTCYDPEHLPKKMVYATWILTDMKGNDMEWLLQITQGYQQICLEFNRYTWMGWLTKTQIEL